MTTTRQTITIYWDEQDKQNIGWAYRIDGGASGAIDGDAAEAVAAIVACVETSPSGLAALRHEIGHHPGDLVEIAGPGMPGRLCDLLDRA